MKIVEYPHPALLHPTVPVRHIDKSLRREIGAMFEAMYEAEGVGLAANQVALPFQVVVMNLDAKGKSRDTEETFVNPVITSSKGFVEEEEGCLSFPGLYVKVRRAKEVTVEAYNLKGEKVRVDAVGLAARAWQHELDHLQGVVFIDRFSALAKLAHRKEIRGFLDRFLRAQKEGRLPPSHEIETNLSLLREAMNEPPTE